MDAQKSYRRILLKLSGELLLGKKEFGIEPEACARLAQNLCRIHEARIQLGIVIGGGNIFRGVDLKSAMPRTPADQMGMLATLMNGIALKQALLAIGVNVALMTALDCPVVAEKYQWEKALKYFEEGKVVIFVGGTGNPYFTTDTAAALRASEIGADLLLKATKVDGIYSKDPLKHPEAVKYSRLPYDQVLAEKLQVMDASAIMICQNSHIPIFVFNMARLNEENFEKVLYDYRHGTLVQ